MWQYFFFLLQAEGLDLNLCFRGAKLLIFNIKPESLKAEDRTKLIQVVLIWLTR